MKKSDFYYELPEELIAQHPIEPRDSARLMTLNRQTGETGHRHFYDIMEILQPGDCLILNNTRVLPSPPLRHEGGHRRACGVFAAYTSGGESLGGDHRPRKAREAGRTIFLWGWHLAC